MTQIFENYESPWLNDELRILQNATAKLFTTEFKPHNDKWIEAGMVDRSA